MCVARAPYTPRRRQMPNRHLMARSSSNTPCALLHVAAGALGDPLTVNVNLLNGYTKAMHATSGMKASLRPSARMMWEPLFDLYDWRPLGALLTCSACTIGCCSRWQLCLLPKPGGSGFAANMPQVAHSSSRRPAAS